MATTSGPCHAFLEFVQRGFSQHLVALSMSTLESAQSFPFDRLLEIRQFSNVFVTIDSKVMLQNRQNFIHIPQEKIQILNP